LARRRRSLHVQDFRVDERERQRARRRRRREAAPTGAACHAPASAPNSLELADHVLAFWDKAAALSRAGLRRKLAAIVRTSVPSTGTDSAAPGALSRAGLAP
jgi:hypothetical protein